MKIPEYDQNVSLTATGPYPGVSGEAAAAPWLGLAKVGEQTMELGKVIQDKQDEIFRVKDLSEKTIQAEGDISNLMQSLSQERDPQTAEQKFADGFAEIKNRTMDGVNDYKVASALTSHLAAKEVAGVTAVKHEAWKWTLENNTADTQKAVDAWTKIAAADENRIPEATAQITGLINANVRLGAWTPETGRVTLEKATKDLYAQTAATIIMNDPSNAPERIKPLLAASGLDPTAALSLETRAVTAQAKATQVENKLDQAEWASTAAMMASSIKVGGEMTIGDMTFTPNKEGVLSMYSQGFIGDKQLRFLEQVLGGGGTDPIISKRNSDSIMADVYMGKTTPAAAMQKIYSSQDILPENKDDALSKLTQMGKSEGKIPPTMEKAMQLYRTTIAPSSFSLNPKAEEMDALGNSMREVWTDYFKNEKKYQENPDLIIKRAIEKTTKTNVVEATPNPYKDLVELGRAYKAYVVDVKSRGGVPRGREMWAQWFKAKGGVMPAWPE